MVRFGEKSMDSHKMVCKSKLLYSIQEKRQLISQIDKEILLLLSKRLNLSREIGILKKECSLGVVHPQVEFQVRERNLSEGKELGLSPRLVEELTSLLISNSIEEQESL